MSDPGSRNDTAPEPPEAASLYRAILDHAADGMMVVDPGGHILMVNRKLAEMIGRPEQELTGLPAEELLSGDGSGPDLLDGLKPGTTGARALLQGKNISLTVAVSTSLMPAGHQLWTLRRIDSAEGKGWPSAVTEEIFRRLVETAPDPIFSSDAKGNYLYVNPAAAANFGMTPEQIVGKSVYDLFPKQIAAKYHADVEQVVNSGTGMTVEHRSEISGRQFWFSTSLQPLRDPDGVVRSVMGIVRDLTLHHQAAMDVQQSDERLRQAVRVANVGIFDHNHLTGDIYWSPQQLEIHDWDPQVPVTIETFLERVHPEDRERIGVAIRRAHDPTGDGIYDIENRIIARDGSIRWMTTRSQTLFDVIDGSLRPIRTVGAVRDITEQKRAEEEREKLHAQLTQSQKMEAVGRLAGGIAHDFNNMLSVIMGQTELIQLRLPGESPLREDLRSIMAAAQHSADLTKQMLAFARKQTIAPKVIDLNDSIAGLLLMLRRLIGENIEIIWKPGPETCTVNIDPAQIDQVLTNLLVNARDAIGDRGLVTIETASVVLDAASGSGKSDATPGSYVVLSVHDNGCGMDQETLEHAFEPFYTTREAGQGTGLGLATVYGIVKQNGGFIDVQSEPGRGTTFRIMLPRVTAVKTHEKMSESPPGLAGGQETILLVEDDPMVLQTNKTILEELGYEVLPAKTVGEALSIFRSRSTSIRLLVTDVVMPGMHGHELADQFRALSPELQCLYISGYAAETNLLTSVPEESLHFLQKPFSMKRLAEKVRDVLNGAE